ncbi:hypothetical protein AAVH_23642 [Aphelenchoides avenae]|nr:hypothetical protein AAVH_23642 [Aphelenchus avenae]
MDSATHERFVPAEELADGPPVKRRALEEGNEIPTATEHAASAGKRKTATTKSASAVEARVPQHWQAVGQSSPQIFDGAIDEALSANKPIHSHFRKSTQTKLAFVWNELINGGQAVFEMNGSFNINVRRRFEISLALLGEVLGLEALPAHVGRFVVDHPGCSFAELRQYHEAVLREEHEMFNAVHENQVEVASPLSTPTTGLAPPVIEQTTKETVLDNATTATAVSSGGNEADSDDEVVFIAAKRHLRRSGRQKVKQEPAADAEESQSSAGSAPTIKQEPNVDGDSSLDLQLSPTPPPSLAVDNVTHGSAEESLEAVAPSLSPPAAAVATSLDGFQCFGEARPCPCPSVCQSALYSGALGDFVFLYQKDVEIRNEHDVRVNARLYHCKGCIEARARSGFGEDLPSIFVVDGHFVHHDPNMPQGNEHRCIRDKREQ